MATILAAALLVPSSSITVSEGERVYRVRRGGGPAVRLEPGRHLALPLVHAVVRLPPGSLAVEGEVEVRSREGVDFEVPFTAAAAIADESLQRLLSEEGAGDPRAVVRAEAASAVLAWGSAASGEALVLHGGTDQAESDLRRRLEPRGFDAVTLRLGRVRSGGDTVAAITTGALRDRTRATGVRVAIIGLDGADWQIIDPLMAQGQLPNLARLKSRGAWGDMKTMSPTLSPLLWTSVATGKPPERHGIVDFLVKDAATGQPVPISSRARRAKALWNIFGDAGRSSAFVAWWATWPAEPVRGWMVSDRVAYSLFGFEAGAADRSGATHPPEYIDAVRPLIVDDASIPLSELQGYVRVTPAEYAALRAQVAADPKLAYRAPVNHLARILASTKTYHAIGLDILKAGQPDLFSVYYQGIDEVCHRFAHDMPPKMEMVTDDDYARYRDAVFAFYRTQDRLLGELLGRLAPDTVVIVLSDHGFHSGSSRPVKEPPYIEGKPGLWHRKYGILIVAGPGIRKGRLDTTGLLDVAPTVLYLSGLPVPDDMQGRVIEEAIDPGFRARFPVGRIASYEDVGRPLEEVRVAHADSQVDAEMIEKLRSLGYVGGDPRAAAGPAGADDGSEGPSGPAGGAASGAPGDARDGTVGRPAGEALTTGHLNEAGAWFESKEYDRAQAAVARVLADQPDYVPAVLLQAKIDAARERYGAAIAALRKVAERDPAAEPGIFTELARLYPKTGQTAEGLRFLTALERGHEDIVPLRAAVGTLLLASGKTAEAERALTEALQLDPSYAEPLTQLHSIYQGTAKVLALEPIVRQGLEKNPKSVVHLNWMGLILEWKKQPREAEAQFRRAIELDPDYPATMANLGALYGRTGRLEEAVAILKRAVEKDPENLEAWVNLGAAQGRLGRSREAVEALETARRKGMRTTTLFNALALAHLQEGRRDKAMEYLRESLAMDPDQKDANALLKAVAQSS